MGVSTNKTAPSVSNPNLNHPKWLRDHGECLLDEGEDRILLIQQGALARPFHKWTVIQVFIRNQPLNSFDLIVVILVS